MASRRQESNVVSRRSASDWLNNRHNAALAAQGHGATTLAARGRRINNPLVGIIRERFVPQISSTIDSRTELFARNSAVNTALVETLKTRTREAALGGPKQARDRHVARGKLLPRDRVERLIDLGS